MGVYIKGMEMPKSCSVCPFCFGANNICPWTREYATYKGRHADCPLVELPPHGDLIDRSDVLAVVDEAYEYGDVIERRDFDENNIPTIVPAERREG